MSGETLEMWLLPYRAGGVTERFDEYEHDVKLQHTMTFVINTSQPG